MMDAGIMNINSIKHRSIESATNTDLVINMFHLTFKSKRFMFFGIIFDLVGLLFNMYDGIIKYFGYVLLLISGILIFMQSNVGIITIIIGVLLIIIISIIFGFILLFLGLLIIGIILLLTHKYKFEFKFLFGKLHVKISSLIFSIVKEYLISKLDYIIIDQMYVENDEEGRENALSIGNEQNRIPSKIIINSIDEGYEEIFNDSGDPPLFTNDEVQFFNQFMKNNINKNQ